MNPVIDRKPLTDFLKMLGNAFPSGMQPTEMGLDEATFSALATYLLDKGMVVPTNPDVRPRVVDGNTPVRITAAGIDVIAPNQTAALGGGSVSVSPLRA